MTRNSAAQVFKGGWEELENAVITDNVVQFSSERFGFFIRPDGTEIFTIDLAGLVETRTLSVPWDVATFGSITNTFSTDSDIAEPSGLFFKDDGTKMFVMDVTTVEIFAYDLPVPWDVSSIVDTPVSLTITVPSSTPFQCVFSTEGDFLFVTDGTVIVRFPLPVPWDITSFVPSSDTQFDPVGTMNPVSAAFKPQGDMMYLGDRFTMMVEEFSLSTLWDITTATPTGNVFTFAGAENARDLIFRTNGLEFFSLSFDDPLATVTKFHLDELWNISSAAYFPNQNAITAAFHASITWKPDGLKYFILDAANPDKIDGYSVPHPFNSDGATLDGSFVVNPPEGNPRGMFWHLDGTLCWITGTGSDEVHQFDLSTPWDITTMSDPGISVLPSGTGGAPQGMFIGKGGLKLYIVDGQDDIMEYNMTVPYDITTLNTIPVNTLDISAKTMRPRDIVFKPNGTMMFIISDTDKTITRYILPTPWSLAGAFFIDSLDTLIVGETTPQGLFIRQDNGKQLFLLGVTTASLHTFDMSLEFNNTLINELGDDLVNENGEFLVAS